LLVAIEDGTGHCSTPRSWPESAAEQRDVLVQLGLADSKLGKPPCA
jgi:hypothetical protein